VIRLPLPSRLLPALPLLAMLALAAGAPVGPAPALAQETAQETARETVQEAPAAQPPRVTTDGPVYREQVLGDPDAPVRILEFSSFTCSHCATYHQESLPVIKERYIDTGKANLTLIDFPLDSVAGAISLITRCAPDSVYWKLVDIYFADPGAWMTRTPRESISGIARLGGMTQEDVDACLQNEAIYKEIIDRQTAAQEQYNITGTPSFVINGEKHMGYGVEDLSEAIDAALEKAGG
jgi:protein-disulfide isomerase